MITAGAEYLEYEALTMGASPAVRVSFLPYYWPNGVNADGTFDGCSYVAPGRILAGALGGYWISQVITSRIQEDTSSAILSWTEAPPDTAVLSWRSADSTDELSAEAWAPITSGDTVIIKAYYQIKVVLEADAYVEDIELLGEFIVIRDIEEAGSITQEAPQDFQDLVSGEHSGLVLNNRQIAADGEPAPLYSPNKTTFLLADQDWYGIQLKIELGWNKGGWFQSGFLEDAWLKEDFTDFITLFLGKVASWGPVGRSVDADGAAQANTVEIYANDWVIECLKKRVALPDTDGKANPLTFGEFLCPADEIVGYSPAPITRSAYFGDGTTDELDSIVESGGGDVSIETPNLLNDADTYRMRTKVTGNSQTAMGVISMPATGQIFVTGIISFVQVPDPIASGYTTIFKVKNSGGTDAVSAKLFADGTIYLATNTALGGSTYTLSKFTILSYLDMPLAFSLWIYKTNWTNGLVKLFINGDEVISHQVNFNTVTLTDFRFGVSSTTPASPESWIIDWSNLDIRDTYYNDAYQVKGFPFDSISTVYIDNKGQPDSFTYITDTGATAHRTITRYPEYGMVHFQTDNDANFKIDGDVIIRVVENVGGRHALEILESLFALAGLTDRIDPVSLAAAYVSCPNDIINARFEGGESQGWGEKDYAGLGIPIADCIKEITARCLYFIFVDAGVIKIKAYDGIPPAGPVKALTASNLYEVSQTIDLEDINDYVTAIYGWYDRNKALNYTAGSPTAGGQGTGLDFSWDGPVACENFLVVKDKADLLLKFLSGKEFLDPVRMNLSGARIEIMDVVSVHDVLLNDAAQNYWVTRQEIGLDPGSRETSLQLTRLLGE